LDQMSDLMFIMLRKIMESGIIHAIIKEYKITDDNIIERWD